MRVSQISVVARARRHAVYLYFRKRVKSCYGRIIFAIVIRPVAVFIINARKLKSRIAGQSVVCRNADYGSIAVSKDNLFFPHVAFFFKHRVFRCSVNGVSRSAPERVRREFATRFNNYLRCRRKCVRLESKSVGIVVEHIKVRIGQSSVVARACRHAVYLYFRKRVKSCYGRIIFAFVIRSVADFIINARKFQSGIPRKIGVCRNAYNRCVRINVIRGFVSFSRNRLYRAERNNCCHCA